MATLQKQLSGDKGQGAGIKKPCFEIRDLSCGHGERLVLEGVSLTLEPGLFYGLAGPNGSGKTTLLDHMLGNRQPVKGSILFQGREVSDYPKQELAQRSSLVPQEFQMSFEFTILDVVMMGRHPYIPRFGVPSSQDLQIVRQAMALMDISHLEDRSITCLSGGEKQRTIVARALAQDTGVLIMDEATSSLDISHTIGIMDVVRQRVKSRGDTVIAAIHDLNLAAAYCDRIILLNNQGVAGYGPTAQVLNQERIREVFGVESRTGLDEDGIYQIRFRHQTNKGPQRQESKP